MVNGAKKYMEIKKSEFEDFLESICICNEYDKDHYKFDFVEDRPGVWKRVEGEIKEYCYYIAVNLERNLCIKVYSSIERFQNVSRARGIDAIRVVAAKATTGEPIRPAFPIVKRIPGWKKNLHKRLSQVIQCMGIDTDCPKCAKQLLLRINKTDGHVFLGCSRYPDCAGNRNL